MADFTIEKPVPFTVEGVDGTVYELPRLQNFSVEQLKAFEAASKAEELSDKVAATMELMLMLCPELENEPLEPMGYMGMFNELAKGSDLSVGES